MQVICITFMVAYGSQTTHTIFMLQQKIGVIHFFVGEKGRLNSHFIISLTSCQINASAMKLILIAQDLF